MPCESQKEFASFAFLIVGEKKNSSLKKGRTTNYATRLLPSKPGEKNRWRICSTCGKFCVDEDELTSHLEMAHKNCEEMECEYCDDKFDNIVTLQQHRRTHEGSKGDGAKRKLVIVRRQDAGEDEELAESGVIHIEVVK